MVGFDGGQPEAEGVGEVVTGALGAVAFDEGRRAEVLQARARAHQGLTTAFGAVGSVLTHKEMYFPEDTNTRILTMMKL